MKKPAEPHPTITLKAFIDKNDYDHLHLPCPIMKPARVITDSGCQSSLLGLKTLHTLGLKKSCLVPVSGNMSAINGEGINILGAIFLRLEGLDNSSGQRVQTAVMAHVTESTDRFFISKQAMRELGISPVSGAWKETWEAKEQALKNRLAKQVEKLDIGSHALKPLIVGDQVRIQNQSGSCPTKWDKTGTVVQIGQHN